MMKSYEILKPFEACTPQEIQQIVRSGKATKKWNVGDKHNITLNGTVGAQTFTNDSNWDCYIIGFNHNKVIEGNNTLHLQFISRYSDRKKMAFDDNNYNTQSTEPAYLINTTATNTGGWEASYMRQTICQQFLAALPAEWQAIITPCPKWTNNYGKGTAANFVTETQDKIFLLSAPEVFSPVPSFCNSEETNKTARYAWYASNNTDDLRRKWKISDPDTSCIWWLRSPNNTSSTNFIIVTDTGKASNKKANFSEGFSPACMIS